MPKLSLVFPGYAAAQPAIVCRTALFFALQHGCRPLARLCAALTGNAREIWGTVSRRWSESGDARVARRQHDYLAQAGDRYDLDYRIRELDRSDRAHSNYR